MTNLFFQNRIQLFLLINIFTLFSLSQYGQVKETHQSKKDKIDLYVKKITKKFGVTGSALAVIHKGKVIYKNYSGKSNLEYNVAISEKTLFRLHSLSKIFVSTKVFQMIEEGKISLEDTISKYLDDLPQEWQGVKIQHLLSHSSGLPDIREVENTTEEKASKIIYSKEIRFPMAQMPDYNQTNFWLLNRIIRVISKENFNDYVLKSQFNSIDKNVGFSSVSEIVPNRISEYKPDKNGNLKNFYFEVPKYMFGAAGLSISLDKFIKWNQKFDNNELLNSDSKTKVFTPFEYKKGKAFTIGGWDVQNINESKSYGFNGGGLANFRKYPKQDLTVIWLTNGYRIPYNIDAVSNEIAGIISSDLIDKTPQVAKLLKESFLQKTNELALKDFYSLKRKYPFINFQNVLNGIGYTLMNDKKIAKAIAVFSLNTKENPNSANAFDSLAEAYFISEKYDLSITNYKKAIALGGTRGNAKMMLEKINNLKKN